MERLALRAEHIDGEIPLSLKNSTASTISSNALPGNLFGATTFWRIEGSSFLKKLTIVFLPKLMLISITVPYYDSRPTNIQSFAKFALKVT